MRRRKSAETLDGRRRTSARASWAKPWVSAAAAHDRGDEAEAQRVSLADINLVAEAPKFRSAPGMR
jgi:hypothetical protein